MVYRNGWKEFFITAIGFGAPMSLFFIIQYGFALGLAGGVLAGLLFGGAMTLVTRGTEKKFAGIRAEISADRPIICEGGATWQGIGGWMFFTREGLEFFHGAVPGVPSGENPSPFNLISACHHACGAVAACYESNECIIDDLTGPHLSHEQILRMHEILFEECFAMAQEQ